MLYSHVIYMYVQCKKDLVMGRFGDTVAILNSIVSNSYYGMLRWQIGMYLSPKHAIIAI